MPRLGHDSCNSNEATPGKSQVATFRSGTRRSSRLPFSPGVNLSRSSIHRAIEAEPNRTSWQALGASEHPGTAARGSSPVRLDASGSIDDRRSRGGKGRSSKKANQGRSVQSIRSTQAMLIDEVRTARASWGSQPLPPGQYAPGLSADVDHGPTAHPCDGGDTVVPPLPFAGQPLYAFPDHLALPSPLALPPPHHLSTTSRHILPPPHFSLAPTADLAHVLASDLSYATPPHLSRAMSLPFTPSPVGPSLAALAASHGMLETPAGREAVLAGLPFEVSPEPPLPSPMSPPGGGDRLPSCAGYVPSPLGMSALQHYPDPLAVWAPELLTESPSPPRGFYWPFVAYEGPSEVVCYDGPDRAQSLDLWDRPEDETRLSSALVDGVGESDLAKEVAFELPVQISYAAVLGFSRSRKEEAVAAPGHVTEPPAEWAQLAEVPLQPVKLEAAVDDSSAVRTADLEGPSSPSPFRRASAQLVDSPTVARTKPAAGAVSTEPEPSPAQDRIVVKLPSASFSTTSMSLRARSVGGASNTHDQLVVVTAQALDQDEAGSSPHVQAAVSFVEPEFILVERRRKEGLPCQASLVKKRAPPTPAPRALAKAIVDSADAGASLLDPGTGPHDYEGWAAGSDGLQDDLSALHLADLRDAREFRSPQAALGSGMEVAGAVAGDHGVAVDGAEEAGLTALVKAGSKKAKKSRAKNQNRRDQAKALKKLAVGAALE